MLSLIHVYWAFGGNWDSVAAVPSREGKALFEPSTAATLLVAALLAAAATVCLARVQLLPIGPPIVSRAGVWVLAAVFTLRAVGDFRYIGFFKSLRDTDFARLDSLIYSPLCIIIALSAIALALTAE